MAARTEAQHCWPTFRQTWRTGPPASSPDELRTRCPARIRFVSSRGRSKHSTSNDAEPGTTPKVAVPPPGSHDRVVPPATRNTSSQSRYALWKNPGDLTRRQRHQLNWIAKTDPRLWRTYLLKEALRYVFGVKGEAGTIARPVDELGAPLSHARTHPTPTTHRQPPRRNRRRTRHRTVPRGLRRRAWRGGPPASVRPSHGLRAQLSAARAWSLWTARLVS